MADDQESFSQSEDPENSRVVQRRRRPPLSCTECRRRKLKCDRSLPCGQCVRSKAADSCVFVGPQPGPTSETSFNQMSPPVSRRIPSGSEDPATGTGSIFVFDSKIGPRSDSNRVSKRSRPDELHELRNRLRVLENALNKPHVLQTPETSIGDVFSDAGISTMDSAGVDDRVRFLPDTSFRGKKGKTRYFGRSHYTTTVSFFQDIGSYLRRGGRDVTKDREYSDMKRFKCELWSRESTNHQRAFREEVFRLEEMVPPRRISDKLVQYYLDTFETTYRVLHIPTFLEQYTAYWNRQQEPDMSFLAQLLAILAAGSCFYLPSLDFDGDQRDLCQKPAMKWIMAVQSYISCTFVSPEINFKMVQTQVLLLIARLGIANDGDVAWASSGSLIRSAMTMGLHRDPTRFRKKARPFWCEQRRRLWTTIVELDLKISLDRGVPPSVDLDECDCDAPSNWDDTDLSEKMETDPTPSSMATYTRGFYQSLLSRTLPLRYRIAKKINALRFDLSYDEALRMGEELVRAIQQTSTLFEDNASSVNTADLAKHRFAQSLNLFIMRKFLLALHRPFSLSVVRLPKCSYSRKVCLEASLGVLSQMELPAATDSILYPHITQLGNGIFRDETFHAAVTVCVELSLQSQEMGNSTGPIMDGTNSSVLMSMVQSQQSVMLKAVERTLDDFGRRVGPGGNGCKPYFFLTIILASVQSRIKGQDPMVNVEESSKKSVRVCRGVLNGLAYSDALISAQQPPVLVRFVDFGLNYLTLTNPPSQVNQTQMTTGGPTPVSASSMEMDPNSHMSTDFGDFGPMDLGSWVAGLDPADPELWDEDFFANLPAI
ncbi:transcriptional regulator family: Fungal Specific TF [Penicillium verhagenii]|nr:transcriptional regulator family: Fungal Specific TF [Penicillium verhagenii]